MTPDPAHVAGLKAAHARLLDGLAALDDATARRPSLLPGWSVGHVLTHLARNAESHSRMLQALVAGTPPVQYPGGREQRTRDIQAGAGRPADELVADLAATVRTLEHEVDTLPPARWEEPVQLSAGPAAAWDLPFRRWRETEIHHADLGLGFGFEDWSPAYVREELRRQEMAWRASNGPFGAGLPEAALRLPPARRLAWLTGRLDVDGLPHRNL